MDEETQQKIFEPFFSTKDMGRASGLGLASTYGIIKNHGGFIDVYSEKGYGTTFKIYLPASEKPVPEEKTPPVHLYAGSETILLVDDEDTIINVTRHMVNKLGYEVFIARSGQEALEIYEEKLGGIDLVILDMIMPGLSGEETYDYLKNIDPEAKVLLSSGYSIDGKASEILKRGCNGFIQKPFSMKDLSTKLREMIETLSIPVDTVATHEASPHPGQK